MLSPQIPSFLITPYRPPSLPITPYHSPSSPIISYPSPFPPIKNQGARLSVRKVKHLDHNFLIVFSLFIASQQ